MRRTLPVVVLMLLATAVMMGCTDSIVPCTTDEDCTMDWGWGDKDAAGHPGPDIEMVCNMDVSPLEKCEKMMSCIPPLDWLPFGDWINLPDCEALYGDLPEDTGTCESSWGDWW